MHSSIQVSKKYSYLSYLFIHLAMILNIQFVD
nr:MAG TPA: hypothetical protein [Caudoviricetes sp.]